MKKLILFLVFVVSLYSNLYSQETIIRNNDITKEEILYHIKFLSSEKFQGRRTGEGYCDTAAMYIENEFRTYGLKPMNNSYRQKYEFVSSVELGKNNSLSFKNIKSEIKVKKDYIPLVFSSNGKYDGKIVFAGYGISDSLYDDYKNINVKDKLVIIFSGTPEKYAMQLSKFRDLRMKTMIARDKGVKGIILINRMNADEGEKLIPLKHSMESSSAGILAINLSKNLTKELFTKEKIDIGNIQSEIDSLLKPKSFELKNSIAKLSIELEEIKGKSYNVVGFIEGNDPKLKDEVIVIGGHYDHLGMGGEGSLAPDLKALHPGADDNASGTAGVLELAQYFNSQKSKIGRSLLFIAFSGEEEGLLGSSAFIKNPTLPVEKIVAMVNMDMIGRLKDKKLIVNGGGSAKIFGELLNKYNSDSLFKLSITDDGFSPSDNSSFYGKNIPVMMFFTDLHMDYHRPSDTYDKINYDGEKNVLSLVKNVVFDLANIPQKPEFIKPKTIAAKQNAPSFRVTLGVIPQFGEQVEGMKIQGTKEGGPAAKAGLQGGDIIIKLGNNTVKNLNEYTNALSFFKPGDKTKVKWVRDGKEMESDVEFPKNK